MDGFTQIVPVSDLPRKYSSLLARARDTNQPIILFRRNQPVAGLVGYKLLQTLLAAREQQETNMALEMIKKGEEAFRQGETKILKKPADLWEE